MERKSIYFLTCIVILALIFSCSNQEQKKNKSETSLNENLLKVSGDKIVNQRGDTVYLRGFGLGGMLHLENFIGGYPANEEAMREGLLKVLGKEKYDLFFNEFYKNYFTEPDAEYIHSLGLNMVKTI
jgi:hypothetical protein